MIRAGIYARVSTDKQRDEETIESQLAAVKEKMIKDGATLLSDRVYKDEGFTGSVIERPDLDRLREDIKDKVIDVLYIYDYGRLSRDLTDLMTLKDDIERYDVRIVSLYEQITGNPDTDRLLLQIMGAVYEYERKKTAQRFHNGKIQKAKRGDLVGYNAPYGYRYIPIKRQGNVKLSEGKFELYAPEAIVVRQMFEWVGNEGLSTRQVATRLYEKGIPPRKGKQAIWTNGPIRRILRNETYIGLHHYNKSEAVLPDENRKSSGEKRYSKVKKTSRKMRPKEDWLEIDVPAVIDEDLFKRAQERITRNHRFGSKNKKHEYLLTGLIRCSCDSTRVGDGPADKRYYRCTQRIYNHPLPAECKEGGLRVRMLDALVWKQVVTQLTDPKEIKAQFDRWKKSDITANTKDYSEELKQLTAKEERYASMYGEGYMKDDIYKTNIDEINKRRSEIASELAEN